MDEQYIYIFIGICILLFIIITIYSCQCEPSLIGLTIKAAEEKLKLSGKKIKLGEKIGFITPNKNQFYLLGKISEQKYIPSSNNEYDIINYKLYQLDIPAAPPKPPLVRNTVIPEYIHEYIPHTTPSSPPKMEYIPPTSPKRKLFQIPKQKNTTKQYGNKMSFFW